ncbi:MULTISPECIES: hypothetical protein [Bacillus cereus group]|uniref:hypothetical protein n=1 Tax=Bacillus cereus group TaxID=86661 RepID=UPI0005AF39A5|nr:MULTISPECIES: hypothetical protein [Bacillus cereus group]KIP29452.1 hypothetical protein BG10_6701 [Bacillus thuringiensis serovar morrisoni]MCT6943956.1 hypothetical protein [Bacillus thuringiensis]MED2077970.1 hypothetical protein [Bacillus thuringiensis]MEE2013381.1 hypothetical protein [Bacillus thuringiensis]NUW49305.1 hypothetical protein [Bacillus thuringiensis]
MWKKLKVLTWTDWKDIFKESFKGTFLSKSWLLKTFGFILLGATWQQVAFEQHWYNWVAYVVGTIVAITMVEEGYKKK